VVTAVVGEDNHRSALQLVSFVSKVADGWLRDWLSTDYTVPVACHVVYRLFAWQFVPGRKVSTRGNRSQREAGMGEIFGLYVR